MQTNRKHFYLILGLIAINFFWTSGVYLQWLYHLMTVLPQENIDFLTEVVGYLFQALGLLLFLYYMKKKQPGQLSSSIYKMIIFIDFLFACLCIYLNAPWIVLTAGYAMNLFHGIIAGIYLSILVSDLPQQNRATVFGLAYALGSIANWLVAAVTNRFCPNLPAAALLLFYLLIAQVTELYFYQSASASHLERKLLSFHFGEEKADLPSKSLLLLAIALVLLLSTVKGLGFYFPLSDVAQGSVSLESARAFYAVGLILAGLLGDLNRKHGLTACLVALICPFLIFLLTDSLTKPGILWIISYAFTGFYTVYRVTLFGDMAGKSKSLFYLAGAGLLFGRLGDALSVLLGLALGDHYLTIVIVGAIGYGLAIVVSMAFYNRLYLASLNEDKLKTEVKTEESFQTKEKTPYQGNYDFTKREEEVLELILAGKSTSDITKLLYISENTVKFHIKNILKKTNCKNRKDLVDFFH